MNFSPPEQPHGFLASHQGGNVNMYLNPPDGQDNDINTATGIHVHTYLFAIHGHYHLSPYLPCLLLEQESQFACLYVTRVWVCVARQWEAG